MNFQKIDVCKICKELKYRQVEEKLLVKIICNIELISYKDINIFISNF